MCRSRLFVGLVILAVASAASAGNFFLLLLNSAARSGDGFSFAASGQIAYIDQDGEGQDTEGIVGQGGVAAGCGGSSGVLQGAIAAGTQQQDETTQQQELGYAAGQIIYKEDGCGGAAGAQGAHIGQEQVQTTEDPCPCPPDGDTTTEQSQELRVVQAGAVGGSDGSDASVVQVAVVTMSQTQDVGE